MTLADFVGSGMAGATPGRALGMVMAANVVTLGSTAALTNHPPVRRWLSSFALTASCIVSIVQVSIIDAAPETPHIGRIPPSMCPTPP